MSLSVINSPPLVAGGGILFSWLGSPLIKQFTNINSFTTVRVATLLSYALNFVAVSRPGRLDGEVAAELKEARARDDGSSLSIRNGSTFFVPAGWAFAIWGPIFLGELIFVLTQFLLPESSPLTPIIRQVSGPFIVAQLFQSAWCASFRKKYFEDGMISRQISTYFLAATAYSLSKAQEVFTSSRGIYSNLQYALFFLPISLHFGWTTAATLVNLNGASLYVMKNEKGLEGKSTSFGSLSQNIQINIAKALGLASSILATGLGVYITLCRSSPIYGGVIAWALSAVSSAMKQRLGDIEDLKNKKGEKKKVSLTTEEQELIETATRTQGTLSKVGAWVSASASFWVVANSVGFDIFSKSSTD